jgi:signal transduction histidine kinase
MTATGLDPLHLKRLLDVGRGLVSKHDPEDVLQEVLAAARELTGARYAALGILDDDKRELDRFLFVGIDEETRSRIGPLPRGHGLLGELIREPRALRLPRIADHPHSYGFPAGHPPMETFLGVPVMIRGEVYGNLYLTEKTEGQEFSGEDQQLLEVLAEWAAIAIDNARSHATSERRREELERAIRGLEATVSLDRAIGGETDLGRVLELVVKRGRALVEARSCAVLVLDGELGFAVGAVAGEIDQGIVGQSAAVDDVPSAFAALRAGRSQRISGSVASRFANLGVETDFGLVVGLRSRGLDLGVLAVFDRVGPATEFSADDELALESFATSAATGIAATQAVESEKARLSIASSERERQRWARELHDETLQELGALNLLHQTALQLDDPESMRDALSRASEQVERIIAGLHGLITELRPAALDQLGTGAAVEVLADRLRSRSGLEIDLDLDQAYGAGREPARHSPELEATIYRTVQEALNNVLKHAGAKRAKVLIEERNSVVSVIVEDDGRGFDADGEHDGFGLLGLRERVALSGGELHVGPGPDAGTRICATFPVSRASP